ncbi:DNA-3-methyladenine glycosylase 2 family protein [Microbispora sp. SCL1-1]|uniref:DNA-3-methyladenine glycosylase family protein n=1 Tax=unclassified Microbispora TaxID=2614687 RepID=UPI0011594590|nr:MULTISPECIES: DNA-3-methyladenine glycosylase [unclassified Microbispora]NJP26246.1 DNA-3-methyladenine glycosylase 2 family protein [Microbispora sp. CL1-1]TQS12668.1 DNA-3-methyladenine glycosylase 2 family protein [Microbispora sp. SCL1-1]
MTSHGFTITAEGPYDFGATLRFVEDWPVTGGLPSDGRALRFAYCAESDWLPIGVTVTAAPDGVAVATTRAAGPRIRAEVARILSLDVDGSGFAAAGEADPVLGDLQRKSPGLRPLCFWSPWEAACWAVIVQRSSMLVAARIKQRIGERYGAKVIVDGEPYAAFPPPMTLLRAGGLGLPAQKEEWLRGLAQAALDGVLTTEHLRALDPQEALAELRALPGVGPFSAGLILIRGAGAPDAFPGDEPRLFAILREAYGLPEDASPAVYRKVAEAWRPYRSWASFLFRATGYGAADEARTARGR